MSEKHLTLRAFIAALLFKRSDRRAIVAKRASKPRPSSVALQTIHRPSVPFVVTNYQRPNSGELPVIVAIPANNGQNVRGPNDTPNRGVTLSRALALGRTYHPLCRQAFTERVTIGYYAYEQRQEWRTCALAAAYAGIFGPGEIERPDFSYSQACWLLGQVLGYDPAKLIVEGPTGRRLPVAEEMIALTDVDLWTRRGVAAWLGRVGL